MYLFLEENKNDLTSCEFLIPIVLNEYIKEKRGKVKVIETTATWYGITYKEDKELVTNAIKNLIENKIYPEDLWQK